MRKVGLFLEKSFHWSSLDFTVNAARLHVGILGSLILHFYTHSIRLLKRLIAYCSTDYELYHAKNNMIYLSNLGLYHSGESTPLATNFIYSVGTNLSTT